MLRKIFISLLLFLFAGAGIYAIALLTGRIKSPQEIKQVETQQEDVGPVQQIRQALNLNSPNDLRMGEVNSGVSLITAETAKIEENGFIVVYDNENPEAGNVLGFSLLLQKGTTENVPIRLKRLLNRGETIYLGFRLDDGDGFFDFSGRYDKNVTRADGRIILIDLVVI